MKPSVLVVDDEQSICSALRRTFHQHKFQVYEAHNGMLGLDALRRHPVDVIISDQRMPGMKGTEFLTIARQQFPNSRRIILSGQSDINDLSDAINKARIHQFIPKPWDDAVILKAINDTVTTHPDSTALTPRPPHTAPPHHDIAAIYPSYQQKHVDLEQAIKNDTLRLTFDRYEAIDNSHHTLDYLSIHWQQFPHLCHENIITLAKQSGYLADLYLWYLFKSQAFFEQHSHIQTPVVLDLFCQEFPNNKSLSCLTQLTLNRQNRFIFRLSFELLRNPKNNKLLASICQSGNSLLLRLGKRIININELANTAIAYIEMDGRQTIINNSSITEKRLKMINHAEFLSIKTLLTGVNNANQRHYAQLMGFNFCNKI
ncbi:MAG: response regulator [Cellvibrionaceae bacterium]|nr:response regulator [Cellvibrionaceae bacterium]